MNRAAVEPLIVSLALLALGMALFPLPMLGLVGIVMAPLALVPFARFVGASKAGPVALAGVAVVLGFLVYGAGLSRMILDLFGVALAESGLRQVRDGPQPALSGGLILAGFAIFALGLRGWTGLSFGRSAAWASLMLPFALLCAGTFLLFAAFWPLSA
jgi:hypothetical protein